MKTAPPYLEEKSPGEKEKAPKSNCVREVERIMRRVGVRRKSQTHSQRCQRTASTKLAIYCLRRVCNPAGPCPSSAASHGHARTQRHPSPATLPSVPSSQAHLFPGSASTRSASTALQEQFVVKAFPTSASLDPFFRTSDLLALASFSVIPVAIRARER